MVGSIILREGSIAYEVTHDRRKGRYALVGKEAKDTVATARREGGHGENRVALEMCGWDVFRMGGGRSGGERSEMNEIGEEVAGGREARSEEAVGELTSRGVRIRRYIAYVRCEVPLEVVAFTT